jgi:hypothetical protein
MRPHDDVICHEAAHVAMTRLLGMDARVEFRDGWPHPDGAAALTYSSGGDRSALNRSVVSYAPMFVIVQTDWASHAFSGDRELVEKCRPAHWPAALWEYHVREETRARLSERFWALYAAALEELWEQTA